MTRQPYDDDFASRPSQYGPRNERESRDAPKRPGSSRAGATSIFRYFRQTVGPVSKGKRCSVNEAPSIVGANVKWLREDRGLSIEEITAMIDEFAERVAGGRINVTGRSAWRVFMKTWHTFGRTASSTLSKAMEQSEGDEDPWKV